MDFDVAERVIDIPVMTGAGMEIFLPDAKINSSDIVAAALREVGSCRHRVDYKAQRPAVEAVLFHAPAMSDAAKAAWAVFNVANIAPYVDADLARVAVDQWARLTDLIADAEERRFLIEDVLAFAGHQSLLRDMAEAKFVVAFGGLPMARKYEILLRKVQGEQLSDATLLRLITQNDTAWTPQQAGRLALEWVRHAKWRMTPRALLRRFGYLCKKINGLDHSIGDHVRDMVNAPGRVPRPCYWSDGTGRHNGRPLLTFTL